MAIVADLFGEGKGGLFGGGGRVGGATFSDIGGGISDLFAASADRSKAAGDRIEAQNYDLASKYALQEEQYTKESTAIQGMQAERQMYSSMSQTKADIAGGGFAASGSGLDILAQSASQGALQQASSNGRTWRPVLRIRLPSGRSGVLPSSSALQSRRWREERRSRRRPGPRRWRCCCEAKGRRRLPMLIDIEITEEMIEAGGRALRSYSPSEERIPEGESLYLAEKVLRAAPWAARQPPMRQAKFLSREWRSVTSVSCCLRSSTNNWSLPRRPG
jgi:hypothetical protein